MVSKIFISHARENEDVAKRLEQQLKAAGIDAFCTPFSISAGDNFSEKIKEAISGCEELWLLLSRASYGKSWVWWELGAASVLEKHIVPILVNMPADEVTDDILKSLHMARIDDEAGIDDTATLIIGYRNRCEERDDIPGVYRYEAYRGQVAERIPRYQGYCEIRAAPPPADTPLGGNFRWLIFEGLRTYKNGEPVPKGGDDWESKWAALCPDGKIRVEYTFSKQNVAPASFASLKPRPREKTRSAEGRALPPFLQALKGMFIVLDRKKPQQGCVWYTKLAAPELDAAVEALKQRKRRSVQ
jgi:hypothetical protein